MPTRRSADKDAYRQVRENSLKNHPYADHKVSNKRTSKAKKTSNRGKKRAKKSGEDSDSDYDEA